MPGRAILNPPDMIPPGMNLADTNLPDTNPSDMPLPVERPGEPVFAAPWEAKAFALAVLLRDRGLFGGNAWAEALGAECAGGGPYYAAWLGALEKMLAEAGVASAEDVARLARDWQRAAEATPHGTPIRLENLPDR